MERRYRTVVLTLNEMRARYRIPSVRGDVMDDDTRCKAVRYFHERGAAIECARPAGHEGPHRCRVTGIEWGDGAEAEPTEQ